MIRVEGITRTETPRRLVLAFMTGLANAARRNAEMYLAALDAHMMRDPVNGIGD